MTRSTEHDLSANPDAEVERLLDDAERLLLDGDAAQAQRLVRGALESRPDRARALFLAGRLERLAGHHDAALELLERAADRDPAHVATHLEIAFLHRRTRDFERCLDELSLALYYDPDNTTAYTELGAVHQMKGDVDGAIEYFKKALERDPGHARALTELGLCYLQKERFADALEVLERAVERDPYSIAAQNHLSFACVRLEEYDRALEIMQKLTQGTSRSMLWQRVNLGTAYDHTGRFAESERTYDFVLRHEPNNFAAHWNRAHLVLARHDFEHGWPDYRYRLQVEGAWAPRLIPFAPWKGESLQGKTIAVSAEQGLGDQIMFASCIPDLCEQGASVVLECDERLSALFRRSFPQVKVIPSRHELEPRWLREVGLLDYHAPAGNLPGFLRKRLDDFPRHEGYLRADPAKVEAWRARTAALGAGLKVGLSWRGGTHTTRRQLRSLTLPDLLPILRVPGCRFISLQYGEAQAELERLRAAEGIEVANWPQAIDDYDETAALCCALDLTISVCTSVIHLNGALGRPVWVMVPAVAEWRYGRRGELMPWYPAVRLLRQSARGDWAPVIAGVASGLRRRVSERG